jgi:hypothetical protein
VRESRFPLGLVAAFEALAQHRLLDRLIRGRTWIGLVAFALIGIVTLQLGLLELNGGIGRALEREALLQRQNAALSIENSELASGLRIENRAVKLGMSFAAPSALRFLSSRPHEDATKAASALSGAGRAAAAAAQATEPAASSSSESSSSEAPSEGESSEATTGASGTSQAASSEPEAAEGETSASSGASSPTTSSSTGEAEAAGSGETQPSGGIQVGSSGG